MCINFNGYHSGGSSFLIVNGCWFKKKKKKKILRSPSIWFRTPKPVWIRQSGRTGVGGVTGLVTWGDHVDIQVGSCIYLSVSLLWSITLHLGGE